MPVPNLIPFNLPSLSERLKRRTNQLRSRIVRANYNTQFVQTATELTDFRHAVAGLVDGMGDDILSESFIKTVHFTNYDSYAPLIEKLFEKPIKASDVVDLLAPGLPDYLTESSSTSGGNAKAFPKYNRTSKIISSDTGSRAITNPLQGRTRAFICYLNYDRMDVVDEDNCFVKTIYFTCASIVTMRMHDGLDPEKDEERMGTFVLDHAAPFAAYFIAKWRSFLLIHALFALTSRSLESMDMLFISTFVEMIQLLDAEFDMMVDCIANGTIPDLDGIVEVRHHLESNMSPDPKRAAELRDLGRPSSQSGWCGLVWPNLRSISAIASGSFASSLPSARWFLGSGTSILSHGYGSTETWIGAPYNPLNLNMFKPSSNTVFEFLDINESDSISSLAQPWEVRLGKRYELVLTTEEGLWRYRLGDVVEISGFDPTDGDPIIQFVERRNMAIRLPDCMVTEKELKAAVSSMLLDVVNWTATIDDRSIPSTIGFFLELASNPGSTSSDQFDLALAPKRALDQLSFSNANITWVLAHDLFRTPTIRLVAPGTFRDFMQLKLDEGSNNVGQLKVPAVLPKATYVSWFSNRVVQEL